MTNATQDSGSMPQDSLIFHAHGQHTIELPNNEFIADARMTRDGDDLVLQTPDGSIATIEGYFSADPAPLLQSADGATLTPNLVEAFAKSPMEFAANTSANDESPVGAVEEVKGVATVTRADGTVETITVGTPIYQGDVIETQGDGAVNITFMDETSMAVSKNARLAIDEYTFDPSTESGTTNLSVLRGLFVFTSGLIGRDDPDDVSIDTPVGSIGIRGTIIAGEINPGGESNISVLEGAIVVKNGAMEITLSNQFETVRLGGFNDSMHDMGVVPAADINSKFTAIGNVLPSLFSVINEAVHEQSTQPQNQAPQTPSAEPEAKIEQPAQQNQASQPLQDIVTLAGNSTGLTNTQNALPQTGIHDTHTSTPSTTSSVGMTAPASSTPVGSAVTVETPPLVITSPEPVTPTTPAGFTVSYAGNNVLDTANAGTTVGTLATSVASGITYALANNANGYFELQTVSGVATVLLTAAGAAKLGSSLDVVQLGLFDVVATDSTNGQSVTRTITPSIVDAHTMPFSLETASNVAIVTDSINNMVGYSISGLGDFNRDGFDDFIITNNTPNSAQNQSFIIYGGASALVDTNLPALSPVIRTNPATTFTSLETVVSGIGDFNGDGILDYVIGQSNGVTGATNSGNAYIVSGANGNDTLTFTATGTAGDKIGSAVSGAGDFNNDGYADAVIGASGALGGNGRAYLISGTTSWTADITSTSTSVGKSTVLQGTTLSGFGSSVVGLGDFNGDGYSDIAIGAPGGNGYVEIQYGYKSGGTAPAKTLIAGGANEGLGTHLLSLGDINGDGYSDLMAAGNGNTGLIILGGNQNQTTYNLSGAGSDYQLSGAGALGDFNGDGFDDYAIAMADSTHTKIYVVFGKEGALAPSITLEYLKNPLNALEMTYDGANKSDNMLEISGVGDLNGDGRDDFTIGVPDANGSVSGDGGFAVVYGRNTGNAPVKSTATDNGENLIGTSGADTMSDGGFTNMSIRSGAGDDIIRISNTNFRSIDGGGGQNDTLLINAPVGQALNFSNINFEQISGIEKIQFGANDQTITLTMENIFNILKTSDGNAVSPGSSNFLKISAAGMNGAHLVLDADFTPTTAASNANIDSALETYSGAGSVTNSNDGTYGTFHIGGYTLMIENTVQVDIQ